MQTLTETQLRELARKRVDFRIHLTVYLVINSILWLIWYLTGQGYLWPVWPTLGWGIGVVFQYLFDYRSSRFLSAEEEYRKLKNQMDEGKELG